MDRWTLIFCLALAFPASAAHHEEPDLAAARAGIDAANSSFMEAVEAKNPGALGALYTDDAIVLPNGGTPITSRADVVSFFAKALEDGVSAMKLETIDVIVDGKLATETGRYTMTLAPAEGETAKVSGHYLVVWKLTGDGWKLHRDIWNQGPAPE